MAMDVKISCEDAGFKFRVCCLICNEDKYLIVRMGENNFYCLPGGHVELGEDTNNAVLRETLEETGFECKIENLFCIHENFYGGKGRGKAFHELAFYFLLKPIGDFDYSDHDRVENDKGELKNLEFRWVTKEKLSKMDFRPAQIKELITNNKLDGLAHRIFKD